VAYSPLCRALLSGGVKSGADLEVRISLLTQSLLRLRLRGC